MGEYLLCFAFCPLIIYFNVLLSLPCPSIYSLLTHPSNSSFLPAYPSTLASQNAFQKVPLLLGSNSDEGISFSPRGLNSSSDVYHALLSNPDFSDIPLPGIPYQITPQSAQKLLDLYPDDPSQSPPYDIPFNITFADENPSLGTQWRRAAAVYGDIVMVAGRRSLAHQLSAAGEDVYSYRFATRPFSARRPEDGVQHFVNVAYSFQNITGSLGPLPEYESHFDLATAIGRAYVNFVYWGDPNGRKNESGGESRRRDGLTLPEWPRWTPQEPVNMVLNATSPRIEKDDFRREGMAYIGRVRPELLS
jgi:carboxylesterase type B